MSVVCKGGDWKIYADGVHIGTLTNMDIPAKTAEEKDADRRKGLARLRSAITYAMRNPA